VHVLQHAYGALTFAGVAASLAVTHRVLERRRRAGVRLHHGRERTPADTLRQLWWLALAAYASGQVGSIALAVTEHDFRGALADDVPRSVWGGLLLGALVVAWLAERFDLRKIVVADAAGPAILAAYAIGRLGCHVAGDGCWGLAADAKAAAWFPASLAVGYGWSMSPPPAPVLPTSLCEAAICALAAVPLARRAARTGGDGATFRASVAVLALERLLIEIWRTNPKYVALGLHASQAQCIALAVLAAVLAWAAAIAARARGLI